MGPVYLTKVLVLATCRCATQAVKTSLQCETTHSLLQYSRSQSCDSMAGLGQPLRMHRWWEAPPGICPCWSIMPPPLEAGR